MPENIFFLFPLALIPILLLSALRILFAPTATDRVLGLQLTTTSVAGFLLLLHQAQPIRGNLDQVLIFTFLAGIGTTVFVRKYPRTDKGEGKKV